MLWCQALKYFNTNEIIQEPVGSRILHETWPLRWRRRWVSWGASTQITSGALLNVYESSRIACSLKALLDHLPWSCDFYGASFLELQASWSQRNEDQKIWSALFLTYILRKLIIIFPFVTENRVIVRSWLNNIIMYWADYVQPQLSLVLTSPTYLCSLSREWRR